LLLRVGARVTHIGFDRLERDPLHTDHGFFLSQLCRPSAWLWPALVTDYVVFRKLRLGSRYADRVADLWGSLLT
jgi:hypothetical protein